MKKIIIVAVVLAAFSSPAMAQKGFHLIAKGGLNYGKISGNSFASKDNATYHAGGSFEIDFNKKFGIQPEMLFSKYTSNGNTNNTSATLNYLSIPLLLRLNLTKTFTLNVGPEYSILMNSNNTVVTNANDAFKTGNFAMVAGFSLNLKTLRLYGRYNAGMSDINDVNNQGKWKSEAIQVGVGLKVF